MRKLPGFFNVYNSSSSNQLPIPSAFSSQIGAMPDMVDLRNVNGKLWPVEVTNDGNRLFFTEGWAEFVEDNSVEIGDLLVFDYDGHHVIKVRLLGIEGCEKLGMASPAFNDDDDDGAEEAAEDDGEDEEEEDGDEDEEDHDKLGAETLRNVKRKANKERSSSKRFKSTKSETTGGNRRKPDTKCEDRSAKQSRLQKDVDIFKYGVLPWPKNPFFVARIREKRRSQLYIPKDVIEDHKLKIPSNIALIDEEGKKWPGLVKEWKDGRNVLVRGWKEFCKWNHVNPADRCICEFIQGKGRQGIFLKMRILRKGSWLPKH